MVNKVILCDEIADRLVESARHEVDPGRVVRTHMQACAACRERWEAEERLTAHMKGLRAWAWDQRSATSCREELMRRFAERDRPAAIRAWGWSWALAAAAALAISIFAVPGIENRLRFPASPTPRQMAGAGAEQTAETVGTPEIPADLQADPEEEGFVEVPFVPPLATGEMVRVVHTELNPAALASLGVSVDPAWTTQLPADVLMGEDGMPRAVRVSDSASGNGGF